MADDTTTPPVGDAGTTTPPVTGGAAPTFDSWFESLGEGHKALVTEHTTKLKGALENERQQRKALSDKLREAQAAAEKGSKLEADLAKLNGDLEVWQRRAQFYESAPSDLANARLAWMLATSDDLFDKKGDPDWEAIRGKAPELFSVKKSPPGNAGSGSGSGSPAPAQSMNAFIRAAAGRTSP